MTIAIGATVAPWIQGFTPFERATVTRTEVVRPAMCGHNSLFVGHIGDWTWDAVSEVCGTDVLRARNRAGDPTYLSFYYYRVRGSRRFHLRTPTFGDRLHVTTRLFDFGSESVLALHRIGLSAGLPSFEVDDFYAPAGDGCLYVETFNRWISRRERSDSNRDLVKSSPADFEHAHLPRLPERYSPRDACRRARTDLTFSPDTVAGPAFVTEYPVDLTRDFNGVGLLHFAAYFSIVDGALLRYWRHLGRSDRSFLDRVVVDQQLCYLGNADSDCVVESTVVPRHAASDEVYDVVLRDRDDRRVLAVSTLRLLV
ncbi:MAG: LnmK family bifunctional acyltransferase/decarboxylase [Acidimicrobiales bacterium]